MHTFKGNTHLKRLRAVFTCTVSLYSCIAWPFLLLLLPWLYLLVCCSFHSRNPLDTCILDKFSYEVSGIRRNFPIKYSINVNTASNQWNLTILTNLNGVFSLSFYTSLLYTRSYPINDLPESQNNLHLPMIIAYTHQQRHVLDS